MTAPAINELNDALKKPYTPDEVQRRHVAQSLVKIGTMLIEWGDRLNDSSKVPDVQTVRDAAAGISDLARTIRNLNQWANSRDEDHWIILQGDVTDAQNTHWSADSQALISTYLGFLENPPRNAVASRINSFNKMRFKAAIKLIAYAQALSDAGNKLAPDST